MQTLREIYTGIMLVLYFAAMVILWWAFCVPILICAGVLTLPCVLPFFQP